MIVKLMLGQVQKLTFVGGCLVPKTAVQHTVFTRFGRVTYWK